MCLFSVCAVRLRIILADQQRRVQAVIATTNRPITLLLTNHNICPPKFYFIFSHIEPVWLPCSVLVFGPRDDSKWPGCINQLTFLFLLNGLDIVSGQSFIRKSCLLALQNNLWVTPSPELLSLTEFQILFTLLILTCIV